MYIKVLQKTWNELGKKDPLWAVLTVSKNKNNKWHEHAFFDTGKKEISMLMRQISRLNLVTKRKKALDFGCGVGRLTQALVKHFDKVYGVDIAPSMIDFAKAHNKYPKRCKYFLNETTSLSMFVDNSLDLIYSNKTLQHIKPRYTKLYIKEFLRILAPGGLLVFQLPAEPVNSLKGLFIRILPSKILNSLRENMEMHGITMNKVTELLKRNHAEVITVEQDHNAGDGWVSFSYYVRKIKSN